ncbi:related to ERG20-farnesyl-pyrophosphate synthetase [Armillaria ostoyae]|uniref:Related to ERG20-farnesyl-pyrophosphate synthetase n=1 Tax=Armillaria ostoyae TaxID=47428 RepID=A0A284RHG3_ARMOS|nr:related to ERG20-farnesyl-pyrophosphate synthetase [Armillaria ostoyae]
MSASETQIFSPPVVLLCVLSDFIFWGISEQKKSQTRPTVHIAPLPYRAHLSRPSMFIRHADRQGNPPRAFRGIIKQELLDYITGEGMPKDAIEWYERNLDYTVPGGKLNRGIEHPKAAVLDWGIELLRVPKVGQVVINDSFMLEAAIYYLLKKHFRGESYYLITAPEDEVYLSKFSLNRNQTIEPYALPKSILIPLGEYFQIQGDFVDFSGTPEQIGTDILDNKCSWCVNTALAVCTPEQRRVLDDNYGRNDPECERRVKVVFESPQVDLRRRRYEEKVYRELIAMIGEITEVEGKSTLKREVFKSFIDNIYNRTK